MKNSSIHIVGVPRMIAYAVVGGLAGFAAALMFNPLPLLPRSRLVPMAYRVPKIPDGTPLRMAMVHDVLHERYLRHGSAWYEQRIKNAREIIARNRSLPTESIAPEYLDAMDNLAIGLQSVGQFEEAAGIMRAKLAILPPLPTAPATLPASQDQTPDGRPRDADAVDLDRILAAKNLTPLQHQQYTACANLGTILVHGAIARAFGGDSAARVKVQEGLAFIEKAVAINPGAHFGREKWQAIVIEHLLAAMEHPDLLEKYDLIGDRIDETIVARDAAARTWGRRATENWADTEISPEDRLYYRRRILRIGMDQDWIKVIHSDYSEQMPFDEPTLAIIGMWTLGGGPSPHFALALGNIMEQIGQREIAWNGYERAVELQDRFWPDPAVRSAFVADCRAAQSRLAGEESPNDPDGWQAKIRGIHQRELAWGLEYQKAYQDYEAAQIAAGVAIDRSDFYDGFFKERGPIASPSGVSDDVVVTTREANNLPDTLPCMVLFGGGLMLLALATDAKARAKSRTARHLETIARGRRL